MNQNAVALASGTRKAVETAIERSKGERRQTWENAVKRENGPSSHWDALDSERQKNKPVVQKSK
jgi:hypothetical protein